MLSCLAEWSSDATPVVSGNAVLFDDFPPTIDAIYDCLFAPSDYDNVVEEILIVLFSTLSSLLTHLVAEHLPNGNMMNLWLKKQQTQSARGILHNLIASLEKNQMHPFYHKKL